MVKEETDATNSVTTIYTWSDIARILEASGHTGGMKRLYGNRIKYRQWLRGIVAKYGSITNYMYQERLRWTPVTTEPKLEFAVADPEPFADPADYVVKWNDWPYGSFEDNVKHLIVWLKAPLPSDPATGQLQASAVPRVQAFVDERFIVPMEREAGMHHAGDNLMWFKNGFDLQSIRAIDHFHVLVRDVPDHLLREWTQEPEPEVPK